MPVIGRVQIDANITDNSASPDFISSILKAAQWDIKSVSIRNSYSFPVLSIIADMWSSLDQAQIAAWIREDLGSRFDIGAISVKVLSRTGKAPTTPKPTTQNQAAPVIVNNNSELAAVNIRLDNLIATLSNSKAATPNKKKTIDDYAAEFGVSKTALTLLVAALGITILLSITAKK